MKFKVLLLLPLALALTVGQELLTNGDFEQDISVGWDTISEGSGTHTYSRDASYQPDPDYEACAYQYDNPGAARISQRVAVGAPMLEVTFSAKFEQSGGSSTCWPAACVCVSYLDAAGAKLGETRYVYSTYASWVSDDTLHRIDVSNPDWSDYSLDVMLELADNFPNINPADVAQVEVAPWAYTYSG